MAGLSGYLPKGRGAKKEMGRYVKVLEAMKMFLVHGTKDMLAPVNLSIPTWARAKTLMSCLDEVVLYYEE